MPKEEFQLDPTVTGEPSLTGQGKLQGTVLYMSPEQVEESAELDHRTDIYSLGAVLYEVLTGEQMIARGALHEMMTAVRENQIDRPSERARHRDVPARLEEICLRCVSLDPKDRFQTANDLLLALQEWSELAEPL